MTTFIFIVAILSFKGEILVIFKGIFLEGNKIVFKVLLHLPEEMLSEFILIGLNANIEFFNIECDTFLESWGISYVIYLLLILWDIFLD